MEFNQLKNILEAALLAATAPMSIHRLAALFDESENVSNGEIGRALESLGEDCAERGVELVEVASGYRYQVRLDVHDWVAKMWTDRPSRYSRALLETLALIAYRQPITRGEIEAVRGVSVSSSIIRTLEEREWIRVVGHRDVPGRPALFGTTREFLDYFNLKSLDELPSLAEIRDMESFDPELNLEGEGTPARASMPGEDAGKKSADAEIGTDQQADAEASDAMAPARDDGAPQDAEETPRGEDAETGTEMTAGVNGSPSSGENADIDVQSSDEHEFEASTASPTSDGDTMEHPPATADEAPAPTTDNEQTVEEQDTEENRA